MHKHVPQLCIYVNNNYQKVFSGDIFFHKTISGSPYFFNLNFIATAEVFRNI